MEPQAEDITELRRLYSQGQYLQAWRLAQRFAPLRQWRSTAARLIGGRLAMQLGAPRLGRQLHVVAWRHSPAHPEAIYYQGRYLLERFGPVSAWRFARRQQDWSVASPELQADWWALLAVIVARLRDWDRAESWLEKAEQLAPHHPWPLVERAGVYELAERYEEGLAAARRALELRPWYRPAVQAAAQLLTRLGQTQQALELLAEADQRLECGLIAAQIAILHYEQQQYTQGLDALDRFEARSPLLEEEGRDWLAARRADLLLRLGRYRLAASLARTVVSEDYYQKLAGRLSQLSEGTPAPAPLRLYDGQRWCGLSITRFLERWWWQAGLTPVREASPPSLPHGLPAIQLRLRWQENGWLVRDFRLDADTAARLLQRGCPFLLHVVDAGYIQSRLVIGYDPLRDTLLLVDTDEQQVVEAPLSHLLERQAAFGPRGTVCLPRWAATRLHDLPLPDAPVYDALAEVQKALHLYDRPAAVDHLERLRQQFPEHPLVLFAELALALYDAHPLRLLHCYDRLLERYPNEPTWLLGRAAALRELQRHEEREAFLAQAVQAVPDAPLLLLNLAQALLPRVGQRERAGWLLRRALRLRPSTPAGHFLLASLAWECQRFTEALDHYRFACTLEEDEDQFAEAYARTCLAQGRSHEALRLFQNRGPRAAQPQATATRALYFLLWDRGDADQAWLALDQSLEKLARLCTSAAVADSGQPEGASRAATTVPASGEGATPAQQTYGELLLFRAEQHAAAGRFDAATADLQAARPYVSDVHWLWSAARIARCQPDFQTAATHLQELTRLQPFDLEAQRFLLTVLTELGGQAAVRARLELLCQQHPHHYPLLKLRVDWLSNDPEGEALSAVRALLQECTDDAAAWRQLAILLVNRKRLAEAEQALQQAERLEPDHLDNLAVRARLLQRMDRVEEARETLQAALRRDVDQESLIELLMQVSRGRQHKQAALAFLLGELRRQPHSGEGLIAFLNQSLQLITERAEPDPEDLHHLLESLQEILDARPDLWYAWSMVISHMAQVHRLEEADALARSAVERFPLVGKLWLDWAQVCQGLHKNEEQLEALRQAAALAPGWPAVVQGMAEALQQQGRHAEAVAFCEAMLCRNPLEPSLHALLAQCLWEDGRSQEALERIQTALRHEPGFDAAWQMLQLWSERLDQPHRPAAFARDLTQLRPGNPETWLRLTRLLTQPTHADEALAALERALALDPRRVEAYDLKAEWLTELGRYEEALAAARPPQLAAQLPLVLQGRAAWIEARRGNYETAIPSMQALVALEPSYLWGWLQLAEWYNATEQAERYLEAANQLVRLQPGHPGALAMRGEARLKSGDREGARDDLREALRIAPNHSYAAALLFDICLKDAQWREARQALALLQEHMTGPLVALKQVQLAVCLQDQEAALRAFAEICEADGPDSFPLYKAWAELQSAGWEAQALPLLRHSWQSGGPFHPWAPILWIQSSEGQQASPAERLRALDVLVKAYPRFVPGHDAKAELLTLMGRYQEALAVCQPPDWNPLPVELRARAAWIEARRRRLHEAIRRLRQLLQEHPSYGPGWLQLAEWYAATGAHREALETAEQAVRREPRQPLAYVVRGHARRQLGEHRGARSDYQQALQLDPDLEEAAVHLIALLLQENELDEALRVYNDASRHHDKPWMRLRFLQIACCQGDREAALTRFHTLAREPDTTLEILRQAADSFDRQQWTQTFMAELRELVFDPRAVPLTAVVWVERLLEAGEHQRLAELIPQLRKAHPSAARLALLTLLEGLAQRQLPVQGLVTHHADLLRADTEAWAVAGRALAATAQYAHAAAWLADWRTRPDLRPHMLQPLVWSYRLLDQDQRAADVCHAALQLSAPDEELVDFLAWAALEAALARRTDEAAQLLARLEAVGAPDNLLPLAQMTRALLLVLTAGTHGRTLAFREARQLLRSVRPLLPQLPGATRAYRQALRLLAYTVGTFTARCWTWWQLLRT